MQLKVLREQGLHLLCLCNIPQTKRGPGGGRQEGRRKTNYGVGRTKIVHCRGDRREENFKKKGIIDAVKQVKESTGHCKGMDWADGGCKEPLRMPAW